MIKNDDNAQQVHAIIHRLSEINVDGETVEYIIDQLGMREQMLRQLVLKADWTALTDLMVERDAFDSSIMGALRAQRESFAARHGRYPDTVTLGPTAWRALREALLARGVDARDGIILYDMTIYEASNDERNECYKLDKCIIGVYDQTFDMYLIDEYVNLI